MNHQNNINIKDETLKLKLCRIADLQRRNLVFRCMYETTLYSFL